MKLYHNPRCSKSRNALELLNDKGLEFETVLYLKDAPTKEAIQEIVTKLDIPARELIRFGDKLAKELGITKKTGKSNSDWLQLLVDYPALIERPILINGEKAAIGRPLENIEAIL